MGSDQVILEKPYGAAMSRDWKMLIDNEEQPLKDLLEIVKERAFSATEEDFLETKNRFGNTVLHEATIYGNYEADYFELTTEWLGSRIGVDTPGFSAEYSDSLTVQT
ncbi:hypothetical protein NC652_027248 [Populus alba x Populus x berolinensis]|nr:hypothetical protein NC652_027248 [Populus alba x Populus x berolinensis]